MVKGTFAIDAAGGSEVEGSASRVAGGTAVGAEIRQIFGAVILIEVLARGNQLGEHELIGVKLVAQARRLERLGAGVEAGMSGTEIEGERADFRGIAVQPKRSVELGDRGAAALGLGNGEREA